TRGHVDVQVVLLENGFRRAELGEPTLRERDRGLCALLHHVAELTGQNQLTLARYFGGFDEQDVAAGRRPRKPGRDAGHARPELRLALEARRPEDLGDLVRVDLDALGFALGDLHRDVAQHGADLALEIAHARFARIAVDDEPQRIVVDRRLLGLQAVRLELALDQIALRDLELLVRRIARELDDLHAV